MEECVGAQGQCGQSGGMERVGIRSEQPITEAPVATGGTLAFIGGKWGAL